MTRRDQLERTFQVLRLLARPGGASLFDDSFGVHGGRAVRHRIRFTPAAASYVRERAWHPTQVLADEADGGLLLEMRVAGSPEVKSWVQSFGADAQVLEPAGLARAVEDDARRVLGRAAGGALALRPAAASRGKRARGRRRENPGRA